MNRKQKKTLLNLLVYITVGIVSFLLYEYHIDGFIPTMIVVLAAGIIQDYISKKVGHDEEILHD